ncbi:MAG: HEAT repeat domain-containing protein [Planctomycetota bacterium JB042]
MRRPALVFLALASLSAPSAADVVHRHDAEPLLGAVRPGSDFAPLVVETLDGPVEVERAAIAYVEDGRSLERSLAALRRGLDDADARGRMRLVDWALRKGRFDDALELADEALRIEGEGAVDDLLPEVLLDVPVAGVRRNDRLDGADAARLLACAADGDRPARARVATARLRRGAGDPGVLERLLDALEVRRAATRLAALEALAGAAPITALPALLERMLEDGDAAVRAAAIEALRPLQDERVVLAIVRGLRRDDVRLREAAMDAAEALHAVRAVGQLVRNLRRGGASPAPSGSTSITTQRAFVQDFDVDVANSAFIANPNVGVLQSGVVLDAKVLDTVTSRRRGPGPRETARIVEVLAGLTGTDLGADAARWAAWLEGQRR